MRLRHKVLISLASILATIVIAAHFTPTLNTKIFSIIRKDNKPINYIKIAPNLYHVGSHNTASYLIKTNDGLILIDAGYKSTVDTILRNIKALKRETGYGVHDVKLILNTHAHMDHASGFKRLKEATCSPSKENCAEIYASFEGKKLLEAGGKKDFALKSYFAYPPVTVDKTLEVDIVIKKDGTTAHTKGKPVELGGIVLTPYFTPGHTKGCTSWSIPIQIDNRKGNALLICSLSLLHYNILGMGTYQGIGTDFKNSLETLNSLPCDILLLPHGKKFNLTEKSENKKDHKNPFFNPEECKSHLKGALTNIQDRFPKAFKDGS